MLCKFEEEKRKKKIFMDNERTSIIPALALKSPPDTTPFGNSSSSSFKSPFKASTSIRLSRAPALPITPSRPSPSLSPSNDDDLDRLSPSPFSSSPRPPLPRN